MFSVVTAPTRIAFTRTAGAYSIAIIRVSCSRAAFDVRRPREARRDVDDRAAAHLHVRRHGARQIEGDLEVQREGSVEMLVRRVARRDVAPAARIVDEHVDPAEGGERCVDDLLRRVSGDEVAVDRDRAAADLLDRRAGPQQLLAGPRDADHRGPDLGEGPRDLRADAPARAGHDRGLPVESERVEDHDRPRRLASCIRRRGSAW
jgi:hypothetical protein